MWWARGAAAPRGRVRQVSGAGDGPRIGLAAVGAHRRAVAPRAARARVTTAAGCGIGRYVAGDGVTAAGAHLRSDLGRHSATGKRGETTLADAREARYDNSILHAMNVRSAVAEAP